MYLYKQKKKDGDVYLAIKEKYHVQGVGSRERIGYLSELAKKYEDPVAHFSQYAKELTQKTRESQKRQTLTIDMSQTLEIGAKDTRNVGYGILKLLYKDLEQDKFWNWKTRGSRAQYNVDENGEPVPAKYRKRGPEKTGCSGLPVGF